MSNNKKKNDNNSSEVVNSFRSCRDLSDIIPLFTQRSLYLKPVAKVNVSVNLPQLKIPGKTISTWDVMEKIRMLILPDEFASLKVVKSTLEFIRLEGDLGDKCQLQCVLARLDCQRLNLAGFPTPLKIRAAETKDDFPTRHSWDSYFRDAKHMNELKAGERPDTIHISGLPIKWFCEEGATTPSESLITKIFKKWGTLKRVDVPLADPYRNRMRLGTNIQKFSYDDGIFFDAYVQYNEYMDFVRAMDGLRGMKLLKKDDDKPLTVTIKVNFDKTKHMSDSSVAHREFERKRLIAHDALAADRLHRQEQEDAKQKDELKKKEEADHAAKIMRREKREEKRKRKALTKFRKEEEDRVTMKIAREERKLIKAQRQLESIRLLDELFDRIKTKVERGIITLNINTEKKKQNDAEDSEKQNTGKESKKVKKSKKKKVKKEKKKKEKHKSESSDSNSSFETEKGNQKRIKCVLTTNTSHHSDSVTLSSEPEHSGIYSQLPQPWYYDALPMIYSSLGNRFPGRRDSFMLGRGRGRGRIRGRLFWRGSGNPRSETAINPHLYNEQYYKYFASLVGQDYRKLYGVRDRKSSSRTRGRRTTSRSRSRSRSRTWSRSRIRRSSNSRSRTRKSSRTRSRRNSRSTSDSKIKKNSRSRSRTIKNSKVKSQSRSRSSSNSNYKTKSKLRSESRSRKRSKSKSPLNSRKRDRKSSSNSSHRRKENSRTHRNRSKSPNRHNNSKRSKRSASKIKITRARSRSHPPTRRSRSKSWSLPKSPNARSCSWSKNMDDSSQKIISDDNKNNLNLEKEPEKN